MIAKLAALATGESEQCQQGKRHQAAFRPQARDIERMGAARKHQFANAAATCAGPNNAPIATTVRHRCGTTKIASRCADMPDGTKA